MTTTHPLRRTPIVTLAAVADLVTLGSTSRAAELRAARARRLHAEASAHAAAELELMRATEAVSAETFVTTRSALAHSLAPRSASCATLLAAECLHVATVAAGVGYWTRAEALAAAAPLTDLLIGLHGSWGSFAESFLAGEQSCGRPDDVRHVVFAQVVARLLSDPRSPWLEVSWPDAEAA